MDRSLESSLERTRCTDNTRSMILFTKQQQQYQQEKDNYLNAINQEQLSSLSLSSNNNRNYNASGSSNQRFVASTSAYKPIQNGLQKTQSSGSNSSQISQGKQIRYDSRGNILNIGTQIPGKRSITPGNSINENQKNKNNKFQEALSPTLPMQDEYLSMQLGQKKMSNQQLINSPLNSSRQSVPSLQGSPQKMNYQLQNMNFFSQNNNYMKQSGIHNQDKKNTKKKERSSDVISELSDFQPTLQKQGSRNQNIISQPKLTPTKQQEQKFNFIKKNQEQPNKLFNNLIQLQQNKNENTRNVSPLLNQANNYPEMGISQFDQQKQQMLFQQQLQTGRSQNNEHNFPSTMGKMINQIENCHQLPISKSTKSINVAFQNLEENQQTEKLADKYQYLLNQYPQQMLPQASHQNNKQIKQGCFSQPLPDQLMMNIQQSNFNLLNQLLSDGETPRKINKSMPIQGQNLKISDTKDKNSVSKQQDISCHSKSTSIKENSKATTAPSKGNSPQLLHSPSSQKQSQLIESSNHIENKIQQMLLQNQLIPDHQGNYQMLTQDMLGQNNQTLIQQQQNFNDQIAQNFNQQITNTFNNNAYQSQSAQEKLDPMMLNNQQFLQLQQFLQQQQQYLNSQLSLEINQQTKIPSQKQQQTLLNLASPQKPIPQNISNCNINGINFPQSQAPPSLNSIAGISQLINLNPKQINGQTGTKSRQPTPLSNQQSQSAPVEQQNLQSKDIQLKKKQESSNNTVSNKKTDPNFSGQSQGKQSLQTPSQAAPQQDIIIIDRIKIDQIQEISINVEECIFQLMQRKDFEHQAKFLCRYQTLLEDLSALQFLPVTKSMMKEIQRSINMQIVLLQIIIFEHIVVIKQLRESVRGTISMNENLINILNSFQYVHSSFILILILFEQQIQTLKEGGEPSLQSFDLSKINNIIKERTKKRKMGFLIKNSDKLKILKKFNDILQPLIQILIEGQIELHEESRGVHNLYEDLYQISENIPILTIKEIAQVCQKLSNDNVSFIKDEFERLQGLHERRSINQSQEHNLIQAVVEEESQDSIFNEKESILTNNSPHLQTSTETDCKEDNSKSDPSTSDNDEHQSEEEDHPEYSIIGTVQPPYLRDIPKSPYCLVLDLDETLVHYQELEDGGQFLVRPYAEAFLKEMSEHYEIIIFTAALQDYADFILDIIDAKNSISHKLYRQHTIIFQNSYTKDLSKIGRDVNKTIIIDNLAENFKLQPENGIQIQSWYGEPEDRALFELTPLLKQIVQKKFKTVQSAFTQYREKTIENLNKGILEPHLNLSLDVPQEESQEVVDEANDRIIKQTN